MVFFLNCSVYLLFKLEINIYMYVYMYIKES